MVWVLGLVEERFVARVYARGKVTIPLLVREVLDSALFGFWAAQMSSGNPSGGWIFLFP